MPKVHHTSLNTFAIVDDHRAVADIVAYALQKRLPVSCVGRFYSVDEASAKLPSISPKVVITDWRLGQKSSLLLIKELKKVIPDTRWLLFTAWPTSSVLSEMLPAGIDGCVSKSSDYEELAIALDALSKGNRHFCQESLKSLGRGITHANEQPSLTQTEREILRLVAAGRGGKEIASELNIALKTIHNNLTFIRKKLGVNNIVELANFAINAGIAPPPR